MENIIPKTNRECYALLDEMLSEEEKQDIIEKGVDDPHFSLGMWIRNNWLYSQSIEDAEKQMMTFSKRAIIWDADGCSSIILESYRKHLKRTFKK